MLRPYDDSGTMSARALVLSSDAKAARVLRDTLTEADFSVDVCTNVASTLESLTSETYSLVVVDVADSRERDGLLRQLRGHRRRCPLGRQRVGSVFPAMPGEFSLAMKCRALRSHQERACRR